MKTKLACCICNNERPANKMLMLSFAIPRKDKPHILDYRRRYVCSDSCAETLRQQKGEILPPTYSKHHLTPKQRGGGNTKSNLLRLKHDRHVEWHKCFGNRTLEEVIDTLIRIHRKKNRCLKPCPYCALSLQE